MKYIFHPKLLDKIHESKMHGRKSKLHVLKTAIWYFYLAERLNVNANIPLQLERALEPIEKPEDSKIKFYNCKWRNYPYGTSYPVAALVDKCNVVVPGSKKLIHHPLWIAMEWDYEDKNFLRKLRSKLTPTIANAVYHNKGEGSAIAKLTYVALRRIHKKSALDALCCFVILLNSALLNNQWEEVSNFGVAIYEHLLILCSTEPFSEFSTEIKTVFAYYIFNPCVVDDPSLDIIDANWARSLEFLQSLKQFSPSIKYHGLPDHDLKMFLKNSPLSVSQYLQHSVLENEILPLNERNNSYQTLAAVQLIKAMQKAELGS